MDSSKPLFPCHKITTLQIHSVRLQVCKTLRLSLKESIVNKGDKFPKGRVSLGVILENSDTYLQEACQENSQ